MGTISYLKFIVFTKHTHLLRADFVLIYPSTLCAFLQHFDYLKAYFEHFSYTRKAIFQTIISLTTSSEEVKVKRFVPKKLISGIVNLPVNDVFGA